MANGGLRRMMDVGFPKRKLNSNPNKSEKSVGFWICKQLVESDIIQICIRTPSHP